MHRAMMAVWLLAWHRRPRRELGSCSSIRHITSCLSIEILPVRYEFKVLLNAPHLTPPTLSLTRLWRSLDWMIWAEVGGPGWGWTGEHSWSGTEVTSTLGGAGAGSENRNISNRNISPPPQKKRCTKNRKKTSCKYSTWSKAAVYDIPVNLKMAMRDVLLPRAISETLRQ